MMSDALMSHQQSADSTAMTALQVAILQTLHSLPFLLCTYKPLPQKTSPQQTRRRSKGAVTHEKGRTGPTVTHEKGKAGRMTNAREQAQARHMRHHLQSWCWLVREVLEMHSATTSLAGLDWDYHPKLLEPLQINQKAIGMKAHHS